jgi:trans-2,3-dihydro-3-hydroxyanthranilate isomerase
MHTYTILDVFTDVPLEGNPVAVFDDGSDLDTELMQRTAREMNLSETVFLVSDDGDADAAVRIFTPAIELPFAGHPVLGTAFLLGERTGAEVVRLSTGAGVVPVALIRSGNRVVYGAMEQPIPSVEPYSRVDELLAALRVDGSELPVEAYTNGLQHVYVALGSEDAVAAVRPDMAALAEHQVGVSCFAGPTSAGATSAGATSAGPTSAGAASAGGATPARAGLHVKTRMFGPGVGVPEDPATGSAAGPLALHLALHGRIGFGQEIDIRQGVEIGRPSLLRARVEGSPERVERIVVGGSAVTVARGEYRLA